MPNRVYRCILRALALLLIATGAHADNVQTATNTAALSAMSVSGGPPAVMRLGYATAGDAPSLLYIASSSPCSMNSGSGDGGAQVSSADGKCWIATFPAEGADIREWGAKADGSTLATSAFNAAFAAGNICVLVPPSTNGFYVDALTIPQGRCLRGSATAPGNYNAGYAGTSWIKCVAVANSTCVLSAASDGSHSPGIIERITIVGSPSVPNSGAVGYQMTDGYNITIRDLSVFNFDTCTKWGPTIAGIAAHVYNLNQGRCRTHYSVVDGFPEVYFYGGRWGMNNAGDFANSDDFVLFTRTTAVGAGGGPNTVILDGIQFNPGVGGVGCAFKWGGYTGSGGAQQVFKITNSHVEYHTYTGSNAKGFFCSDNTVPTIRALWIDNVDGDNGLTGGLFNFNSATALQEFHMKDTTWNCSGTSIDFSGSTSYGEANFFTHNTWCGTVSWAGGSSTSLFLNQNTDIGKLTLSGPWGHLVNSDNMVGGLADTATGNISASGFGKIGWIPAVKFGGSGGSSTGWTYTSNGFAARLPNGGFKLHGEITFSAKAGGSATGSFNVSGSPYLCSTSGAGDPGGGTPMVLLNMSGLVTSVQAQMLSDSTVVLTQYASVGQVVLTDANFTASSQIQFDVECNKAQ